MSDNPQSSNDNKQEAELKAAQDKAAKKEKEFQQKYQFLLKDWKQKPPKVLTADEIAEKIFKDYASYDRLMIGELLAEKNDLSRAILEKYAALCVAENKHGTFVHAVRNFSKRFFSPIESETVDKFNDALVEQFLKKYPNKFPYTKDNAGVLANSIMLLNTDLHGGKVKNANKMSKAKFVSRNLETNVDIALCLVAEERYSTEVQEMRSAFIDLVSKKGELSESELVTIWKPFLVKRVIAILMELEGPTEDNKQIERALKKFGLSITLTPEQRAVISQKINEARYARVLKIPSNALNELAGNYANIIIESNKENALRVMNNLAEDKKNLEKIYDDISTNQLKAPGLEGKEAILTANQMLDISSKMSFLSKNDTKYKQYQKEYTKLSKKFSKQMHPLSPENKDLVIKHVENKIKSYKIMSGKPRTLIRHKLFLKRIKSNFLSKKAKTVNAYVKKINFAVNYGDHDGVTQKELDKMLVFLSTENALKRLRLKDDKKKKMPVVVEPKSLKNNKEVIEGVQVASRLVEAGFKVKISQQFEAKIRTMVKQIPMPPRTAAQKAFVENANQVLRNITPPKISSIAIVPQVVSPSSGSGVLKFSKGEAAPKPVISITVKSPDIFKNVELNAIWVGSSATSISPRKFVPTREKDDDGNVTLKYELEPGNAGTFKTDQFTAIYSDLAKGVFSVFATSGHTSSLEAPFVINALSGLDSETDMEEFAKALKAKKAAFDQASPGAPIHIKLLDKQGKEVNLSPTPTQQVQPGR